MNLNISDLISIVAFLIACLSALYAKWALKESKRQNEISIHSERLNVYKGVNFFYAKLTQNGASIAESNIWVFLEWVQLSEFYFKKSIHERLEEAFKKSLEMLAKHDEWELAKAEGSINTKEILKDRNVIYFSLRDECFSITSAMKVSLRLDES